jgi:cell division protein FtsA
MQNYLPKFFIEINNVDYSFVVGDEDETNNFKIIYKCVVPIKGIENCKIIDFDLVFNTIKENIYLAEQKLNLTFKDTIIILNNFHCSFINLTGFKKLNGSQILKENITYILNSLKSNIDEVEDKKNILHIFNSKYCLDKKKITNLPIGLFGDFYSHELSFCLINENDHNNLKNIFDKCNLKIKKILLKSFVEGSYISSVNPDSHTFFQINIYKNNSRVFYFENDSLKFEQNFNFGSDLVIKDVSKITSLNIEVVKKIVNSNKFTKNISNDELVEKEFFENENENYRKIKKKLIFEIAAARIKEFSDIFIFKNINFNSFLKNEEKFFLKLTDKTHLMCFEESYRYFFSKNSFNDLKIIENTEITSFLENVNKLVNFGWKKEAIPIIRTKKSLIARFFDTLFS